MSRTALILAAHGSRHEPSANAMLHAWAVTLAAREMFDEVVAAFHQGRPTFAEVIDQLSAERIVVVPVMTSEGYYCDEFLPAELAKNRRAAEVELTITKPVGVHPEMVGLVEARAIELAEKFAIGVDTAALAVIGHGTKRNPQSRIATERLVESLRERGRFGEVAAYFLDESPGVEEIPRRVSRDDVLVLPFLISGGPHATKDIPARLGLKIAPDASPPFPVNLPGRHVICDRAIGMDSRLVENIISLAAAAATDGRPRAQISSAPPEREKRDGSASTGLRPWLHSSAPSELSGNSVARLHCRDAIMGTRASRLARWQADHVADLLRTLGVHVEIVELSTLGDRVLDRAIRDLPSDAPFTDEIEAALIAGEIDLAVHSLKDLPVAESPGLALAAVLPRGSVTESLVSRDGLSLRKLPPGSVVGTSSPRRVAQLLAIRPGLRVRPIRGPVDDRVRQVRDGLFDAALFATAGLERLGLLNEITETLSLDDFLPAPAQGAMVIQCRADDAHMLELCRSLDHSATRAAVTAELEFLRPFEFSESRVAAALARCEAGRITLRARLLSLDGRFRQDVTTAGVDPIAIAEAAMVQISAVLEPHLEPQR